MTPGYMTLTLGPRKNPRRKVAFLLEKTVLVVASVRVYVRALLFEPFDP